LAASLGAEHVVRAVLRDVTLAELGRVVLVPKLHRLSGKKCKYFRDSLGKKYKHFRDWARNTNTSEIGQEIQALQGLGKKYKYLRDSLGKKYKQFRDWARNTNTSEVRAAYCQVWMV
jgi:hypothetical protein